MPARRTYDPRQGMNAADHPLYSRFTIHKQSPTHRPPAVTTARLGIASNIATSSSTLIDAE